MIVAFAGQKGGVGKSTTAVCLAVAALERGARVLLVDADPQSTVRTWGEVAAERRRPAPTVVAMGSSMHKAGQLGELAAKGRERREAVFLSRDVVDARRKRVKDEVAFGVAGFSKVLGFPSCSCHLLQRPR